MVLSVFSQHHQGKKQHPLIQTIFPAGAPLQQQGPFGLKQTDAAQLHTNTHN